MQWQLSPSVMVEAGTALGILIVAVYFPWRDISRRARLIGSVLLVIAALWILTHSLEIGTPVASYKAYLMGLQLIWGLLAMPLWLIYITHYVAPMKRQAGRIYTLFGIMPLLAILAMATNHIHGLMWTALGLDIYNPYLPLEPAYGPGYWVFMAYLGVLTIWGGFLILKNVVGHHNFRGWEPWTLILVAVIPLLAAFLEVTGVTQPAGLTIGITPFFSAIGIIALVCSLPRFHLEQIIPIARHIVFERISDGVVVLNMQNRIVDLNPAAEHLAGYTSSEALGLPVEQIWPNWPSQLVLSEPISVVFEELVLTRAGEQRIYNLHIYIITDHKNHPMNKVALLSDATERKRAEQVLKESQERYEELAEFLPQTVFEIDETGNFTFVNQYGFEISGYTQQDIDKGLSALQLFIPEDRNRVLENIRRILAGEQLGGIEYTAMRKNGSTFPVLVYSVPIARGGKTAGLKGLAIDITERNQAQDALRQSEDKYRQLVDNLREGIWVIDKDSCTTFVNPSMTEMLGYKTDEMLGRHLFSFMDERGVKLATQLLARRKEGIKEQHEFEFLRKDGTRVYVSLETSPITDMDGNYIGAIAGVQDVTERRKMQEQLMAQDRLASIGQLVSGVAHEINNPLTGIIGFSELLLARELPDDIKSDLKVINDEAQRTAKIVKNLLTFARKQPEGKAPVDINENIRKILNLRDHEQKVNNIQVITHFASDLPQVMGNTSQLQQVFFNIVINAEFFMLKAHARGTLTIITERTGDFVHASFTDDGPGISPENMRNLFTPFFTTKDVGKGTGLGLSICHGIITEHGGRIYTESEEGKGATFIVEVPIKEEATSQEVAE